MWMRFRAKIIIFFNPIGRITTRFEKETERFKRSIYICSSNCASRAAAYKNRELKMYGSVGADDASQSSSSSPSSSSVLDNTGKLSPAVQIKDEDAGEQYLLSNRHQTGLKRDSIGFMSLLAVG